MGPHDLARVPPAPRVPSPNARSLIMNVRAGERSNLLFACVWTFAMLFAEIEALLGHGNNPTGAAALFILPLLGLGVHTIAKTILAIRGRRAAFVSGTATLGNVASFGRNESKSARSKATVLAWAFVDRSARSFRGSLETENPRLFGELVLAPGSELVVLYDPENPQRSAIWVE